MRKMSGNRLSMTEMLLTLLADQLSALIFGMKGQRPPESLMERLTRTEEPGGGSNTPEDFEAARVALLEGCG